MVLKNVWEFLKTELLAFSSTSKLFNHYKDNIPELDLPSGNLIRLNNLYNYLQSFSERPLILIIGEAPGIKGCRFSGVPFTSEEQLINGKLPFKGGKSSRRKKPYSESTATIFWNIMFPYFPYFFLWNCIPFHPYKENHYSLNRTPSKKEIFSFSFITKELIELLQSKIIIALGKSAEYMLRDVLRIPYIYVRHPSYGGKQEFCRKIKSIFDQIFNSKR